MWIQTNPIQLRTLEILTYGTFERTDYEERNKDNVPEPFIPPPEMKNRLAELLNEDEEDSGGRDTADDTAMNDDHTTSVVEAEVYAAVDHDADLPPPPPIDFDPAFDQVTTNYCTLDVCQSKTDIAFSSN